MTWIEFETVVCLAFIHSNDAGHKRQRIIRTSGELYRYDSTCKFHGCVSISRTFGLLCLFNALNAFSHLCFSDVRTELT